jgi:hypothetical protein
MFPSLPVYCRVVYLSENGKDKKLIEQSTPHSRHQRTESVPDRSHVVEAILAPPVRNGALPRRSGVGPGLLRGRAARRGGWRTPVQAVVGGGLRRLLLRTDNAMGSGVTWRRSRGSTRSACPATAWTWPPEA